MYGFHSVSLEAGLTKATLYNNADIRERIETLRHQRAQVPIPAQVKIEMSENNKHSIIACRVFLPIPPKRWNKQKHPYSISF